MLGRAWSHKAGQGSKEVGIYVPANVDDEDNTIWGDNDTKYGDEVTPDGHAFPGSKPAKQLTHLRRPMAMMMMMPCL